MQLIFVISSLFGLALHLFFISYSQQKPVFRHRNYLTFKATFKEKPVSGLPLVFSVVL